MTDNAISNKINTLADRAMLVRLTRKKIRTSLRDKSLEQAVRMQSNDDSITVSKHIFRDKNNPVRRMLRKADEVYRLHKEMSLPWVDRGPRMIPTAKYMGYMETMRNAIAAVDKEKTGVLYNWASLVQQDIQARGSGAGWDDYPTAEEAERMMAFEVQCLPLPDVSDFRVDVDEATKRSLEAALEEAEGLARREVMERMLEPLRRASEKLAVPIGEQGSIFRDSLIENMRAGIEQARSLNISDDPDLTQTIEAIEQQIESVTTNPQALRTVQGARDNAKTQIDDILSRMGM